MEKLYQIELDRNERDFTTFFKRQDISLSRKELRVLIASRSKTDQGSMFDTETFLCSVYTMYVYSRSGNTWSQARALAGIDGGEPYPGGMTGGRAISGDGKWIFSGAYNNNDGSTSRAGAVYAFEAG